MNRRGYMCACMDMEGALGREFPFNSEHRISPRAASQVIYLSGRCHALFAWLTETLVDWWIN